MTGRVRDPAPGGRESESAAGARVKQPRSGAAAGPRWLQLRPPSPSGACCVSGRPVAGGGRRTVVDRQQRRRRWEPSGGLPRLTPPPPPDISRVATSITEPVHVTRGSRRDEPTPPTGPALSSRLSRHRDRRAGPAGGGAGAEGGREICRGMQDSLTQHEAAASSTIAGRCSLARGYGGRCLMTGTEWAVAGQPLVDAVTAGRSTTHSARESAHLHLMAAGRSGRLAAQKLPGHVANSRPSLWRLVARVPGEKA